MGSIDAEAFREFEHNGWERAAPAYPVTFGRVTALVLESLLDAAHVARGDRLLDVACGPGLAAAAAIRRGAVATGIDFSSAMVEVAHRLCPVAAFHVADAMALPFSDGQFDVVVSNFGLNHTPDPDRALAEMVRVLRPGGRMAFSVWDDAARSEGQRLLQTAIEERGTTDVALPSAPSAHRLAEEGEVRRTLERIGLSGIRVTACPVLWNAPSADAVFDVFLHGTVRLGGLLRAQPPELLAGVREIFGRLVEPHRVAGGITLPMQAVISSATRP